MAMTSDAAALLWSTMDMLLMSVIIAELILHSRYNGPILKSLICMLICVLVIFAFPFCARLDALLDISGPYYDLRIALSNSVWAAYMLLFFPLTWLWWSLHTTHFHNGDRDEPKHGGK